MAGVRAIQKEKTRRALIDAAFNQLSAEKSFSNLSLREVAREAGIAPTSFYRHFSDMDELGLEMVDEAGLTLRQLMRQARKRIDAGGSVVFTAGSNALDMTKAEQDLLKERVILQLRMLAKGGDFAAHKEKMMRK